MGLEKNNTGLTNNQTLHTKEVNCSKCGQVLKSLHEWKRRVHSSISSTYLATKISSYRKTTTTVVRCSSMRWLSVICLSSNVISSDYKKR